jgi:hypothetical protein
LQLSSLQAARPNLTIKVSREDDGFVYGLDGESDDDYDPVLQNLYPDDYSDHWVDEFREAHAGYEPDDYDPFGISLSLDGAYGSYDDAYGSLDGQYWDDEGTYHF